MFLLYLVLTLGLAPTNANKECPCGYGGPCLPKSQLDPGLCSSCSEMSGGFYEQCTHIRNHCDPNPCTSNGTCVPTFGGYFCRCPLNHFGKNCNVTSAMEISRYKLTNEVYVYYQVQPRPDGTNSFYIIHDVGDRDRIYNETGIFVRALVKFDGQFFYPLRGREYLKMDVKQTCKSDSESNPLLYDEKVCEYLPEGEVWTFKFDSTLYGYGGQAEDVVYLGSLLIEMSRKGNVLYDVRAISKNETVEIFSHSYNIFTYYMERNPHHCSMNIGFRHCSRNIEYPRRTSPGASHIIKAIHAVIYCPGVLEVNNWWYLQRNISREVAYDLEGIRDDVPVLIRSANRSRYLRLPPRFLKPGLHMIVYALHMRGAPPNYGVAKEFTFYSKCYIEVVNVPPNLGIFGGENRTASCFESIKLVIETRDDNFSIDEFAITVSCNATASDPECFEQPIEGSAYKKVFTPCGKTYQFNFYVTHGLNLTEPIHLTAHIEFIDIQTSVTLRCLHNCYPINPNLRMLVAANTEPYLVDPISWDVLKENHPMPITFGDRDALNGISRILRMDGNLFEDEDAPITNVLVSFEKGKSRASTKDVAYSLDYWKKEFILQAIPFGGGYSYTSASGEDPFKNETDSIPVEFWVYSIKEIIKEGLLELITTHFDDITFSPSYGKVMLCLRGPLHSNYAEECTRPEVVEPFEFSSFDLISESFESGNTGLFFKAAHFYLVENLVTPAGNLQWKSSTRDRLSILTMILKMELNFQTDVHRALSALSILFYTSDGCVDQDLPIFIHDARILVDYARAAKYLKCNHLAVISLQRVVSIQLTLILAHTNNLRKFPFEDIPSLILRSWTLAYFQDGYLREHQHDPKSIQEKYYFGEVAYWIRRNSKLLIPTLMQFSEVAAKSSPLFYGLRRAGRGSVRAWFARSSYRGLQSYTNRSTPWNVTSDDFAEFFFGPEQRESSHEWIDHFIIEFFEPVLEWLYKDFSLVVVVVKPRDHDNWTSPKMLVDFRRKDGLPMTELPEGQMYMVSLPAMENGQFAKPDYGVAPAFEIDIPVKPGLPAYKYMISYKLNVPAQVQSNKVWILYIYHKRPFELRAKIFLGRPPEVEDVEISPVLKSYKTTNLGREERHCIEVVVTVDEGETIPGSFYLGFLSNESYGILETNHFSASCQVRGFRGPSDLHDCMIIYKGADQEREREWNQVPCNCSHFGIISTIVQRRYFVKILVEPIPFIYPSVYNVGGIVTCIVLVVGGVALVVYAVRKEKKRDLKKTLLFAEDSLGTDINYLVLGVYTGSNPMAGTLSSVAIKITGSESSSRVHLLKSRVKSTLWPRIDDWFIIPTPSHVGKVLSVTIWSNYRLTSDWYCSKLMILDLTTNIWYKAEVERWLRISPSTEDSQFLSSDAYEVEDMDKEVYEEDTFSYYFATELCNTHLPISLFYLNTRSIATFEMRAISYLVKVYGVVTLTWVMQEHVGDLILDTSDLYPSKLTIFSEKTLLLIFLITMTTRLLTWPMRVWFRIVLGTLLIGMLACITKFELFTQYWLKTRVAAFLVTTSLFFDAVMIEPLLIFLRCLVGYSLFRMRNEETNLWDSEESGKLLRPRPLSYKGYVEKATSKEYKPLIIPDIETKRRSLERLHFIGEVAFLLMMIVACCCAYASIRSTEKQSIYYSVRTNTIGFSEPIHRLVPKPVIKADDVIDPESAFDYITSVVAESDLTWPTSKYISKDKRRWGKDHNSWPLGSTNVLVLVMSNKAGKFTVPLEFIDYFYEGRIWGDLDYGFQETEPIFIDDDRVFYNVTSSGFILGKSLEVYPMAGHVVQITVQPWLEYYVQVRDLMLNVFENEGSFIPRAIIFTTNYINPNLPTVVTTDVIVELHTSGIGSARVQVEGTVTYARRYRLSLTLWRTIAVMTVILFFVNVILISKRGLKGYIADPQSLIKGMLFLSCFVKSVSSSFYRTKKTKLVKQVANDPADVFSDFHVVFQNDLLDDGAEAAMIFSAVMYIILRIKFHLGKCNPIYPFDLGVLSIRSFLAIGFLLVFVLTEYEMLHMNELRIVPLVSYFGLREFFPVNSYNWQYSDASIWPCFGFIIIVKACAAYVILPNRRADPPRETLTDLLRRSRKYTLAETPRSTSPKLSKSIRASIKSPKAKSPSSKSSSLKSGPVSSNHTSSGQPSQNRTPSEFMAEKLGRKFTF